MVLFAVYTLCVFIFNRTSAVQPSKSWFPLHLLQTGSSALQAFVVVSLTFSAPDRMWIIVDHHFVCIQAELDFSWQFLFECHNNHLGGSAFTAKEFCNTFGPNSTSFIFYLIFRPIEMHSGLCSAFCAPRFDLSKQCLPWALFSLYSMAG